MFILFKESSENPLNLIKNLQLVSVQNLHRPTRPHAVREPADVQQVRRWSASALRPQPRPAVFTGDVLTNHVCDFFTEK